MKSINFYILTILVFLISTAQSEDNPDLNLASSGGAVIIQDGGSEVDKFLKSKGWKKNKRNTKSNGNYFYVFVGTGEISAYRDSPMIHDSRYSAFLEAFTKAKTNYVKSLGEQISEELSIKTYENTMPDTMAENAIKSAVGTESGGFDKLKKLISVKLDNALKDEGYNTDLADAEKLAIQKKVLRSREVTQFFTATAQSMVSGFQSYKIFEGSNEGERGSIHVIAIWSPKLNRLAQAIEGGSTNVPKGSPKKPIEEQLNLTDANNLLASFGTNMYVNENGNLVLVSYGHASPSIENDPGARSTACDIATDKALANMIRFAREQIVYENMRKEIDKAETFEQMGSKAYESLQGREYNNFISSKSSKKLVGHSVIGIFPIKSPLYKSTDCVAVVQWSAEGVEAVSQAKSDMNSTGSDGSTNQGAQSTTTNKAPSDDF
tara:strand:- start:115 stop:1419 length:1305 start_codon:yes stop_codon:yes gene_type:complete